MKHGVGGPLHPPAPPLHPAPAACSPKCLAYAPKVTWKSDMPLSKPICATGAAARGASAGLTAGASAALNASEGAKAAMASICVQNEADKAGQRGPSG